MTITLAPVSVQWPSPTGLDLLRSRLLVPYNSKGTLMPNRSMCGRFVREALICSRCGQEQDRLLSQQIPYCIRCHSEGEIKGGLGI